MLVQITQGSRFALKEGNGFLENGFIAHGFLTFLRIFYNIFRYMKFYLRTKGFIKEFFENVMIMTSHSYMTNNIRALGARPIRTCPSYHNFDTGPHGVVLSAPLENHFCERLSRFG